MTILSDPAEEVRSWTGPAEDAVRDRYLAAFERALPGLSPEELWFRIRGVLAVAAVDRVEAHNRRRPVRRCPGGGRGGPALGDHVPGRGDECASDRELTTRDGRSR